jgi:hypothetical protein
LFASNPSNTRGLSYESSLFVSACHVNDREPF